MNLLGRLQGLHINHLFTKIACVVVVGVVAVSAFTLGTALHTAREGYVAALIRSNTQILAQSERNMETANDTITNVLLTVNNSWSFKQFLSEDEGSPQLFTLLYDMVKQLGTAAPGQFYDVAVVSTRGLSFVSNGSSLSLPVQQLLGGSLTQRAAQNPNKILYGYVEKGITRRSADGGAFLAVKALTYPGSQTAYGFAYVVLRRQDLQDFMENLGSSANQLMILGDEGIVASAASGDAASGSGGADGQLLQAVRGMQGQNQGSRYADWHGRRVIVLSRPVSRWGLYVVSVLDYARALNEMDGSAYILLVCVLVTGAVLAAVFVFVRQMTRPIDTLVRTMSRVTKEGLPEHIEPIRGGYETRQLSGAFSVMIDSLHTYVRRLMELEKEKRRIEIRTLQMQINPHFIYNTLTSLKWLIWQGESQKAVQGIDTFTLLLRSTIRDSQALIPASEELENLKNYIFLQNIRYGGRIRTNVYLDPSAADCRVPALLLQPFLENAFLHAFPNRPQGMVSVFIDRHGEQLVCEVIDDGVGMPQSEADALTAGTDAPDGRSIGIRNVNERVRLLFGEPYGVTIFSEPGHGTSVKITLPAIAPGRLPEKS